MNTTEFKDIKRAVKCLLEENISYADNDKLLCWKIWKMTHRDIGLGYINYETYLKLPSESTITRARRLIEEKYPHLRGATYNIRKHIKEPEVKEMIIQEKHDK